MKMMVLKISDLAEVISGQSPPSGFYNKSGIGLPFFQGKTDFSDKFPKVRNWCSEPNKVALPNDILMSVRAPVGPVNICNTQSCIGRGLAAIRVKSNISWEYIYYYLKTNELKIAKLGVGSTFEAISRNVLNNFTINIPSKHADQIRIADLLSRAEGLIEQRRESIRLLDELVKGTFWEMFGDVLKETNAVVLGNFIKLNHGAAFKSGEFSDKGVPVIKIGTINRGYFDETTLSFISEKLAGPYSRYTAKPGDLLISLTGTVGKDDYGNTLILPELYPEYFINQRVAKITWDPSAVKKEFLDHLFKLPAFKAKILKANRGVRQANLSNDDIYSTKISIPDFVAQTKFSELVRQVEALKKHYAASLKELEGLFRSLSQRAFRGELDLGKTDDDENDAPPDLPKDVVEKRKKGLILKEQTPVALRTVQFWQDIMRKYNIYPTAADFGDMAAHHWTDYDSYYHLCNQVKGRSEQLRASEISTKSQYITPEFSLSHIDFFSQFIAAAPVERLYELISFIKENPPTDGELYQILSLIEDKVGGQTKFLDLLLHHLFADIAKREGKKRISQETVNKFIEEAWEWGIYREIPYSHIKDSVFYQLQTSSSNLVQEIDEQTNEVHLYVKK